MDFTPFNSLELPASPWKNGGGTTREIACMPPCSSVADFQWRLSIAEIAASGPFSAFPGVDRVITLLEGDGVHLYTADGSIHHLLDEPLVPFAFPGEIPLECDVPGSVCQDFNVMVRRSFGRVQVQCREQPWQMPHCGALLVCEGAWRVQLADGSEHTLSRRTQDGAYWSQLPRACAAIPITPYAQILAVEVMPHAIGHTEPRTSSQPLSTPR